MIAGMVQKLQECKEIHTFSRYYVSCQTIPKDLHVFVHIGYPHYPWLYNG